MTNRMSPSILYYAALENLPGGILKIYLMLGGNLDCRAGAPGAAQRGHIPANCLWRNLWECQIFNPFSIYCENRVWNCEIAVKIVSLAKKLWELSGML